MERRRFLGGLTGGLAVGLAGACATSPKPPLAPVRVRILGICFDLFTLFDPRSVVTAAERIAPGHGPSLCEAWRSRQFEYAWLRAVAGRYADFRQVSDESLVWAARSRGLSLNGEERRQLVDAYSQLVPWPDTRATLTMLKQRGLRLTPLANYAPDMLRDLIANTGMNELFDAQISTHAARTFKPDPRAYALGEQQLGLSREQIAFCAFGGWDAAGARWYGYPTFWVNRLGVAADELAPGAHASGPTLTELASFVAGWA